MGARPMPAYSSPAPGLDQIVPALRAAPERDGNLVGPGRPGFGRRHLLVNVIEVHARTASSGGLQLAGACDREK